MEGNGPKTVGRAGHRFIQPSTVDAVTEDFQRLQDSLCLEFPQIEKVTCDFRDLKSTCSALIAQNRDVVARLLLLHTTVKTSESALEVLQLKGSNMTLTETVERYSELVVKLSSENEYYAKHLNTLLDETEGRAGELLLVEREEELRMLREQLRTRGRSALQESSGWEGRAHRADLKAVEELFGRQDLQQAARKWQELDYAPLPGVPSAKTIALFREVLRLKDNSQSLQRAKSHKVVKSLHSDRRSSDASKSTAIPSSSSVPRVRQTYPKEEDREELIERLQTELALYKGKSRTANVSLELALREFAGKIEGKGIEKHIKDAISKVEKSAFTAVTSQIRAAAEGKFTLCSSQLEAAQSKIQSLETALRSLEEEKAQSFPLDTQPPRPATYSFSQTSDSSPFETKRTASPLTKRTDRVELGLNSQKGTEEERVKSREKDRGSEGIGRESEVLITLQREQQSLVETVEKQRESERRLRTEIEAVRRTAEDRQRLCESLREELAHSKQEYSRISACSAVAVSGKDQIAIPPSDLRSEKSQIANSPSEQRKSQELNTTKQRISDITEELKRVTDRCRAAEASADSFKQALIGVIQHCQEVFGLPHVQSGDDSASFLKLAESTKVALTQLKSQPVLSRFEAALQRCQDLAVSLGRMNESTQGRLLQENLELERRVASQDLPADLPKEGKELTRWIIAKWQDAEEALVKAKCSETRKHTAEFPSTEKDSQIETLKQSLAQARKQLSAAHKHHHRSGSQHLKSLQIDLQSAEILRMEQAQTIARLQAEVEHFQHQLKRSTLDAESKEVALVQSLARLREALKEGLGGARTFLNPYENAVGFVECLLDWLQEVKQRKSEKAERELQVARQLWLQRETDLLTEIRLLSQEKACLSPNSPKLSLTLPTQDTPLKHYYSQY